MKEKLIEYFNETGFTNINDSGETWASLGSKFNITGESARAIWKRHKALNLRSRWQVQTKGGGVKWLESYRNTNEGFDFNELLSVFKTYSNKPSKPLPPTRLNHKEIITVCHLSDKHIGALGTKTNPYSAKEFELRMNYVCTKIIQNPADKLIITDLGDALDTNGLNTQTVRGGHELETNMTNTEIFETYISVHKQFLDNLSKHFKNIEYYHVYKSNHDGNFSYFAARALQLICPDIKFIICEDNFTTIEVGKYNYIITHGKDDKHQSRSLPYHLNPATENYINNYIIKNNIKGNIRFYKGDLHRFGINETQNFTYINVPSVFGSSNYVENNFIPIDAGFIIENISGFDLKFQRFNFY
jgi:hypothetical protein